MLFLYVVFGFGLLFFCVSFVPFVILAQKHNIFEKKIKMNKELDAELQ